MFRVIYDVLSKTRWAIVCEDQELGSAEGCAGECDFASELDLPGLDRHADLFVYVQLVLLAPFPGH